jgi:hypothetical protein
VLRVLGAARRADRPAAGSLGAQGAYLADSLQPRSLVTGLRYLIGNPLTLL